MLRYDIGSSGQSICFESDVLEHFHRYRQIRCYQRESGGQLFAIPDGKVIRIVKATGPRRTDRRTRTSYIPDRDAEATEIVEQQLLGQMFVGDWHTHPEAFPAPSSLDLQSIRECFLQSTHQLNAFILVIVGSAEFPQSLFVSVSDGDHTHRLFVQSDVCVPNGFK